MIPAREYYRGEDHVSSKLREADVREIYAMAHESSWSLKEIGEMFGVSKGTVQHIKSRRSWAWLWSEEES